MHVISHLVHLWYNSPQQVTLLNPYNAEIIVYKPWRPKCLFFQFDIIINVSVSSIHFIWIPICYGYTAYTFSIVTVVRIWRLKTVPAERVKQHTVIEKMSNLCFSSVQDINFAHDICNTVNAQIEATRTVHPNLTCRHGYTDSYGKRRLKSYNIVEEALNEMQSYCDARNINIVELFSRFDADGSMSVSHDEFKQGLKVR